MEDKIKECKYQNICVNFNDNLYSKCPVFGWGNECCYAILYKQLLSEQAKNKKLVEALEKIEKCWNNIDSDKFAGNRIYITLQQALNEVNK